MNSDNLILVGVDETGYGALAGPVTVCACVIKPEFREQIEAFCPRDSKSMSAEDRQKLVNWIVENKACDWVIINEPASVIEKISPWDAVCKAARTALIILSNQLGFSGDLDQFKIIFDGKYPIKGMPSSANHDSMVGADEKILEVMIASLLAKTHRDFYMEQLALMYPEYSWERNKGYGVIEHLEALYHYGPMPDHRLRSGVWKAVKNYWRKNYMLMDPLPKWIADINPYDAKRQETERQQLLDEKRKRSG